MNNKLVKHKLFWLACLLFVFFTLWWIRVHFVLHAVGSDAPANKRFTVSYGVIALYGGVIGLLASKKWGGAKSLLGRTILLFSIGLLLQEVGQLFYTYYIYFKHTEVPYPSLGDIGYFGSVLCYIGGTILLTKTSGVKFSLHNYYNRLILLALPIAMLVVSYMMFLKDYQYTNALTAFLDFGYPLGQAIYISIAILAYLLSIKLLGGVVRKAILFIIFALVVQYVADSTFLYQVQKGTWYAGGWNDYIYVLSYFVMSLALLKFYTTYSDLRSASKASDAVSGVHQKEVS
jgi:hypothetical protein